MKVAVLVPSQEYLTSAGARIRYGRLKAGLHAGGLELRLQTVNDFQPHRSDCDVLLVSKCYDAGSLVAAAIAAQRGILVGVDLFDDYFSQHDALRLARYRWWLAEVLNSCSFALTSTPTLKEVAKEYRPDLPIHVLNDPAAQAYPAHLEQILNSKLELLRKTAKLELAWFGMGDNPFFNVGLSDLAAFAPSLGQLVRHGLDARITVLTGARSLGADGLSLLRYLPVKVRVEEWSEQLEQEVLAVSFATFLPVNGGRFSRAKSLNRAVSSLVAGCQVLSPGYPLYRRLNPFVYDSSASLSSDLARGEMKLRSENLPEFKRLLLDHASSETEVAKLVEFLRSLPDLSPRAPQAVVVLHGRESTAEAHRMAHSVGGLSVASPFCDAEMDFDVVYKSHHDGLSALVSERVRPRLLNAEDLCFHSRRLGRRRYWAIPVSDDPSIGAIDPQSPLPLQVSAYRPVVEAIRASLEELFGPCRLAVSEQSPFLSPLLP